MKNLIHWTTGPLVMLPRYIKQGIALSLDISLAILTVWLAFYLRLGEWTALSQQGWQAVVVAVIIAPPIFIAFGLYRAVFRYVGGEALLAVCQAIFIYGLLYSAIFTAWGIQGVPRTIGLIQPILLLLSVGASRILGRYWLGGVSRQHRRSGTNRVLIYGAGRTGQQLVEALAHTPDNIPVGFIDDARELQGSFIGGLKIWPPEKMASLVGPLQVHEILLAIPSAGRSRRNEILGLAQAAGLSVRTLPGLAELASGRVTMSDIRQLEIEDLLGRDAVPPDDFLLHGCVEGQCILVTGAGGSIGSELCRQLVAFNPRKLLLVDSSEFALYAIHRELTRDGMDGGTVEIVPLLASVCDQQRMETIFRSWRPQIVYHAAAYKHVPLVEQNIVEGVRNNVLGTRVVASLARDHGTARFVLISTDKAVRPTSIMGTSKRLAEMILQDLSRTAGGPCYTMVRFGNVLGSSGSVVPLFRQQIARGGPVTVTDERVVRYFMTIPEAARLVLQAGAMADGGEVFVLDMGEPVRVYELAVRMVELSGLKVKRSVDDDGDIQIIFTGLRPGEKLFEELLIGENPAPTAHSRILMANEQCLSSEDLAAGLTELAAAIGHQDAQAIRDLLCQLVPEFNPDMAVVDWTLLNSSENITEAACAQDDWLSDQSPLPRRSPARAKKLGAA